MRKSPSANIKIKKKMTEDQMRQAILKKKVCDAKAQGIVEKLLEPQIDPEYLLDNLKFISKCHMEDVIQERAITKICGYALCQKPLTVVINQRYHISLKYNKVYDLSKRKNFCSDSCFGASNYLLEQMLTSPLWLRDKEEIPKFKIFKREKLKSQLDHGEVVDISIIKSCSKKDVEVENEIEDSLKDDSMNTNEKDESKEIETEEKEISENIQDLMEIVLKRLKTVDENRKEIRSSHPSIAEESLENLDPETVKNNNENDSNLKKNLENRTNNDTTKLNDEQKLQIEIENNRSVQKNKSTSETNESECNDTDIIKQNLCSVEQTKTISNLENNENSKNSKESTVIKKKIVQKNVDKQISSQIHKSDTYSNDANDSSEKIRIIKKKKRERKVDSLNLVTKVEQNLKEWITEETVQFLFGDDDIKKKAIEKIETQDKYIALCKKLNKLQFEDDEEEAKVLKEKPKLNPAPHFAVLQEEGKMLELKVHAFYQGKTTDDESKTPVVNENENDADGGTCMPLTEALAPTSFRRKIFLEKLDHVLPDLIRTLSGYTNTTFNYTSLMCTDIKALVHTFSLSARNIIFNSAEWTLAGLIILKMLSFVNLRLTTLFASKQANMYTSMILTSYKLDPHYLDLIVASYNPNMNPR